MLTILTLYVLIRHTMASDRAAVIAVALAVPQGEAKRSGGGWAAFYIGAGMVVGVIARGLWW